MIPEIRLLFTAPCEYPVSQAIKMKKTKKRILLIITAAVVVIAVVAGSLAWFSGKGSLSTYLRLGNFKTSADVYFKTEDGKIDAEKYVQDGLYTVSLEKSDDNYIGNFNIDCNYSGYGKAYVRVKIAAQWTSATGNITNAGVLPFNVSKAWFDNREDDYCIYYSSNAGIADFSNVNVVSGVDASALSNAVADDTATLQISVSADAVQINRYPQAWGIEKLPWE